MPIKKFESKDVVKPVTSFARGSVLRVVEAPASMATAIGEYLVVGEREVIFTGFPESGNWLHINSESLVNMKAVEVTLEEVSG